MKIITISREFGSGGRELGKRLADQLGFDYYDREIITAIAKEQGLNENYVENILNYPTWKNMPLTFRRSFGGASMIQNVQTSLLIEQTKVLENIAKLSRDCVIVGRNADVILEKENPLRIFVCADMETKIRRCMERAEANETLTEKEIKRNMRQIDKNRALTREILTGSKWGERTAYHMTVNTSGWVIKELEPAIADFAMRWFGRKS